MKISVILPCYNAAHYLEECLDSLLAQTMGDFEVLLVDDGSKDDTLSVAQKIRGAGCTHTSSSSGQCGGQRGA